MTETENIEIVPKAKTALITGVTGQCGSYLAELLLYKGYNVIGLQRRTSTFNTARIDHIYNHPRFKAEWGNITDSYSLYRILNKYKPEEIYNAAAQSNVKVSFDVPEETLDVVAGGTLKLLNVYREVVPESKFFQFSSSEMCGDNPNIPQNEDTKMNPASPYAAAKLFAHNLCKNYRNSYGLHICCGILFNNESERRGKTFVTRKITLGAANIKLGLQKELYLGNLEAKRDWGYSKDYMEGVYAIMQHPEPDDFVLSTGETHSVKEFAEEVFRMAGLDPWEFIKIDSRLFRPQEVPILLGDSSKARRLLGWEPKVKFHELAKIMYESDYKLLSNKE